MQDTIDKPIKNMKDEIDVGSLKTKKTRASAEDLGPVLELIFKYLDAISLRAAEKVCKKWLNCIINSRLWKNQIKEKAHREIVWKGLGKRRGWMDSLNTLSEEFDHKYFRALYSKTEKDIKRLVCNWRKGRYHVDRLDSGGLGVNWLQYDDQKIVTGQQNGEIKVWDRHTLACNKVLDGHTKGVLCLQYDGDILITGSIDGTVKVWGLTSGELMNTLEHHTKPVAILVYKHGVLVTSAALENVIYVFTVHSSKDIKLRSKLLGYRTDCLALDLDERYIVTAARDFPQRCGDTDIKVWNTKTCEHVRDITGSEEGTITLQYRYPLIVTCCFSFDMKVWDVENGTCLRTFKGHPKLLGFLRFNNKYMVSADGDGVCKIWDMEAILDQQRKEEDLLLASFQEYHSDGSILANTFANTNHLQFDDFIIMTGNSDGTIMIYDFDEEKISQHQGRKNSK